MKLDQKALTYIQNVVETAALVKIDAVSIEPNKLRGIDDERTVVMFQTHDVPEFEFNSIALNRLDIFMSRYEIAKVCDNVEIEVVMAPKADGGKTDSSDFVRALIMKGKGTKLDYRCANPITIQAPKTLNDTPKYKIKMTPEAVLLMTKGVPAMKADDVELFADKDGVSFRLEDINKDAFTYKFTNQIDPADEDDDGSPPKFSHRYPLKHLLTLFKKDPDGFFFLTKKGMIKIVINNLDLYIPPRT